LPIGVQLVDEDDAGRLLLRLLEEVAHPRGSHSHEHLDELRAGEEEERDVGLAGHGASEKRLAVPGGPTSSTPLGMRPPAADTFGVLEEVHDPMSSPGLVHAATSAKSRLQLLAVIDLGLGAPKDRACVGPPLIRRIQEEPDATHEPRGTIQPKRKSRQKVLSDRVPRLYLVLLELLTSEPSSIPGCAWW